nr:hypothetical protein [Amycolatopsis rhizosphaerae]
MSETGNPNAYRPVRFETQHYALLEIGQAVSAVFGTLEQPPRPFVRNGCKSRCWLGEGLQRVVFGRKVRGPVLDFEPLVRSGCPARAETPAGAVRGKVDTPEHHRKDAEELHVGLHHDHSPAGHVHRVLRAPELIGGNGVVPCP